jgi:peptide/nickel transport system permease protein
MTAFVIRRVASVVPTLLLVAVFAFFLVHLTPGDPAAYMLGPLATPAQIRLVRDALDLNLPLQDQFVTWFAGLLHGNLGESLFMSIPVSLAIWQRAEPTVLLALMIMVLQILIGVPAGVLAAVRRNTWVDQTVIGLTSVGQAMPSFALGLVLIFLVGVQWRLLPVAGYVPLAVSPIGTLRSLLMPALTLGMISSALLARMTRSSMLEVLYQDFVRTARAKGALERTVVWRHALRNAALPVLTVVGNSFALLLGGLVITEQVFSIPGVGLLVVDAVLRRDYPVIQGVLLVFVTLYVFVNVAMDVVYALFDPRIRFG